MTSLIYRTELEKELGELNQQEWTYAITKFGDKLNNCYKDTPSKEVQLDELSTLIDEYRRNKR